MFNVGIIYLQNKKAEKLLVEFEKGNKKDYYWLLAWIRKFRSCADNPSVIYDKQFILSELDKAGYRVNSYCEDDYIEGVEYIEAAYLIGQFMSCLKYDLYSTKSILHLIDRFEKNYEVCV